MKLFSLFLGLCLLTKAAFPSIPTDCKIDQECLIEAPGTECADGTPSFFTLTMRANAKHLLIYLTGGGACWNAKTCKRGTASSLTRKETPTDWNEGKGIHNRHDPLNPFAENYNIITVPYCTGDVYSGNRVSDYGTPKNPYVIRHKGYPNAKIVLDAVKKRYPFPEKVVLLGCSAGGIGAFYHLRNLDENFPSSKKYVISDAGTPFKPPYIDESKYREVMKNWGADTTLPLSGKPINDLGGLIAYNTQQFPNIRFGFISSYRDKTMTFFALLVGSPSPFTAIKHNIIDIADNDIGTGSHANVFYLDGSTHCHTPLALAEVSSLKKNMGDWLNEMVEDDNRWASVRPDLHGYVPSALDLGEFQTLP